ncbi:unnamed protein product, partial [Musa acuminata subsp. burmannicoides]
SSLRLNALLTRPRGEASAACNEEEEFREDEGSGEATRRMRWICVAILPRCRSRPLDSCSTSTGGSSWPPRSGSPPSLMLHLPLECVIRRVFQSSKGDECMLLCPVDTYVFNMLSTGTNFSGWSAVCVIFLSFHLIVFSFLFQVIPAAAHALAKIHMHLVFSVCLCFIICHFKSNVYPSNFCFNDNNDFDSSDDGENIEGLPSEGVEITCFNLDGAHYMIYTPSDPLLFVAVKVHCQFSFYLLINKNNSDLILQGENGVLQIADDANDSSL